MKITKTYNEEISVCDYCWREADLWERIRIGTCAYCGKDVCSQHSVSVSDLKHKCVTMCITHLPRTVLAVDGEEGY